MPLAWFCMCLCKVLAPITMKINVLKVPKGLLPGRDLHCSGLLTDEVTVCWEITLPGSWSPCVLCGNSTVPRLTEV